MWVCWCKGVTDRRIRSTVAQGARTPLEVSARCRAGTGCGGCLPEVCRILTDCLARQGGAELPEHRPDLVSA